MKKLDSKRVFAGCKELPHWAIRRAQLNRHVCRYNEPLGEPPRMSRLTQSTSKHVASLAVVLLIAALPLFGQDPPPGVGAAPQTAPVYTPKFKGDPARSNAEAGALGYMRVVSRAEKQFNKQYGHYALTLDELVHTGSFTKRMVNPDRGEYTASYKGKKDSYILTMTPKAADAQHRSFYTDDDGKIRGEESKPADENSPIVR